MQCDSLQQMSTLLVLPVHTYYEALNVLWILIQVGLKICWFINLIAVFLLLVALAIGYGFRVVGSRNIVDRVVLVCTLITMLILSIMGLILSIQWF
jgi:hypothetical protein